MTAYTVEPVLPLTPCVFLTGIEERPNGAVRLYVGPRYLGRYILLDADGTEAARRAWAHGGHVTIGRDVLDGRPIFSESAP